MFSSIPPPTPTPTDFRFEGKNMTSPLANEFTVWGVNSLQTPSFNWADQFLGDLVLLQVGSLLPRTRELCSIW